jgi:hypothetical protein
LGGSRLEEWVVVVVELYGLIISHEGRLSPQGRGQQFLQRYHHLKK